MTHSRAAIKALLDQHGLRPSRALGQNFVADPNTVRRIARMAEVTEGDHVIEVGPGLGSLTLALVEAGARVTAIEMDRRLAAVLESNTADLPVEVIQADAMTFDWDTVATSGCKLVANLPYNVGTHIVTRVLDHHPLVARLVVMLQKEVAQRMVAPAGSDAYGSLSVKIAYHAEARIAGVVPPSVFVPRPDVDSAIIDMARLAEPRVSVDPVAMFRLVDAGFGKRRKMLRGSLAGLVDAGAFERAGIDPTLRAESLDVSDWARLTASVER